MKYFPRIYLINPDSISQPPMYVPYKPSGYETAEYVRSDLVPTVGELEQLLETVETVLDTIKGADIVGDWTDEITRLTSALKLLQKG